MTKSDNDKIMEDICDDVLVITEVSMKLENNLEISQSELKDTELRLNRVISWAQSVSKSLNIPIKL